MTMLKFPYLLGDNKIQNDVAESFVTPHDTFNGINTNVVVNFSSASTFLLVGIMLTQTHTEGLQQVR